MKACVIILFFSANVFGQAGLLDPSFGIAGKVIKNSVSDGIGRAVIVKQNGKIIVSGEILNTQNILGFDISQFQTSGLPDSSFGTNGSVDTYISNNPLEYLRALCMALQNDDKILVGGTKSGMDFAVARYLANGLPDNSFNTNGVKILDLGTSQEGIAALAVLPDDKIIAVGYYLKTISGGTQVYDIVVTRFNASGSLDNSFGINGKVFFNLSNAGTGTARSIAVQPDGKFLVAARNSTLGLNQAYMLLRFEPNGSIDSTFGINGLTTITLPIVQPIPSLGTFDYPVDIKLLPDGKILFGSSTVNTRAYNCPFSTCAKTFFSLVKFDSTGMVDSSFGVNGAIISDLLGYGENINSCLAVSQNKIIIAGWTDGPGDDDDYALKRYTMDGTPDNSFGIQGTSVTDFGYHKDDYLYSIALQPDSKIVVAGSSIITSGSSIIGKKISLARYLLDVGTIPISFIDFNAEKNNSTVLLTWDVSNEFNTHEYQIEKSSDGILFTVAATVSAKNNSLPENRYSWSERVVDTVIFYRICRIGNNGRKDYSRIVKVNSNIYSDIFNVSPNPVQQDALLHYYLAKDDKVNIILRDIAGRELKHFVYNQQQKKGMHIISLNLNQYSAKGIYILQLINSYENKSIEIYKK